MLVEVVSEVLRAPMDSTSEVLEDSADLSLLVIWEGENEKREREYDENVIDRMETAAEAYSHDT